VSALTGEWLWPRFSLPSRLITGIPQPHTATNNTNRIPAYRRNLTSPRVGVLRRTERSTNRRLVVQACRQTRREQEGEIIRDPGADEVPWAPGLARLRLLSPQGRNSPLRRTLGPDAAPRLRGHRLHDEGEPHAGGDWTDGPVRAKYVGSNPPPTLLCRSSSRPIRHTRWKLKRRRFCLTTSFAKAFAEQHGLNAFG
jgi:hypothetical protein